MKINTMIQRTFIGALFFIHLCLCAVHAQAKVDWNVEFKKDSNLVVFTAKITDGWHLYSQYVQNDVGPVPTSFSFNPNPSITLIGKVEEPAPIVKYEEVFEANLSYFVSRVSFKQKIQAKPGAVLTGKITYMICNDSQCLPPTDYSFSVEISK